MERDCTISYAGPDHLTVNAPEPSGGHWTRTGTPPTITASPSILTPRYHGFLQGGVLTDDLDRRSYPGSA